MDELFRFVLLRPPNLPAQDQVHILRPRFVEAEAPAPVASKVVERVLESRRIYRHRTWPGSSSTAGDRSGAVQQIGHRGALRPLHVLVCRRRVSVAAAWRAIAVNWWAAFREYERSGS
jgi:hypothetical protein